MAEFFDEQAPKEEQAPQVDKIKLGNEEYTQADLEKLVGLGKIAEEADSRFNTKVDRIWPEFTKTRQENETLKADLEAARAVANQPKPVTGIGEMDEATKIIARKQLQELAGDMFVTKEQVTDLVKPTVDERIQGLRLLDEIEGLRSEAKADGRPVPDADALLTYMDDTGVKSVDAAYKLYYEKELGSWQTAQLSKVQKQGLETQEGSGQPKNPESKPITRDNLNSALHGYFQGNAGAENA